MLASDARARGNGLIALLFVLVGLPCARHSLALQSTRIHEVPSGAFSFGCEADTLHRKVTIGEAVVNWGYVKEVSHILEVG